MIYDMAVERYSRAVLPARFQYNFPAQTRGGQPLWGDVGFSPGTGRAGMLSSWPVFRPQDPENWLCLYEMFQRAGLRGGTNTSISRADLAAKSIRLCYSTCLLPSVDGRSIPYSEYIEAVVRANPKQNVP